ncbi:hypothetical protein [Streptomyces sp. NBC_01716]|uniref:hypothetical protein n=1 Tax=Streptomyces sp. NBC_01716 TaxID=2975917 RepID=UPI002E315470|nr:hypothetical protein [Streptomyces sp. NBC_01716]
MTTRADDGPEFDPDDPIAVILRPTSDSLGPPPRRYETIRRSAARRRLLRTAAGAGLSCAALALVALPLHLATTSDGPASPTVPLAPPPATRTSPDPAPPQVTPRPSGTTGPPESAPAPSARTRETTPTRGSVPRAPTATPSQALDERAPFRGGLAPSPESPLRQ